MNTMFSDSSPNEGRGLGPGVKGKIPRNGFWMVHMVGITGIHERNGTWTWPSRLACIALCCSPRVLLINILYPTNSFGIEYHIRQSGLNRGKGYPLSKGWYKILTIGIPIIDNTHICPRTRRKGFFFSPSASRCFFELIRIKKFKTYK